MPITSTGVEYTDLGTRDMAGAARDQYRKPAPATETPASGPTETTTSTTTRSNGASSTTTTTRPASQPRPQRPVTIGEKDVGAVTSDGQVIQNPNYTPDAKRQNAFDSYAREGMRRNAEAARQQYYDTIRANDSIRNEQFKKGVDEVNQRGFNLYGVMKDIDASGDGPLSQEQARMMDAAATDFGKQVAQNYGWNFAGAEYDWDKGTFTFQFQNAQGQIGTKTMSRKSLEAQMVKAGYVDDPVEVRRQQLAAQEKQAAADQATAKWAAELGMKQEEMNRKFADMGQQRAIEAVTALSKFMGEDGELTAVGKQIAPLLFQALSIGGGGSVGQPQAGQPGGGGRFAGRSGDGATTDSRRNAREMGAENAELNERIQEQQRQANRGNARANTPSFGVGKKDKTDGGETAPSAEGSEPAARRGKTSFGSGVTVSQEESDELADLRRRDANNTLTESGRKRLAQLEAQSKGEPKNAGRDAEIDELKRREKTGTATQGSKDELQRLENERKIQEGIIDRTVRATARADQIKKETAEADRETKAAADDLNKKYAEMKERTAKRRDEQKAYEEGEAARAAQKQADKKYADEVRTADSAMAQRGDLTQRRYAREAARDKDRRDAEAEQRRFNERISRARQTANRDETQSKDYADYKRVLKTYELYKQSIDENNQKLTSQQRDAQREWESLVRNNDQMANYVLSNDEAYINKKNSQAPSVNTTWVPKGLSAMGKEAGNEAAGFTRDAMAAVRQFGAKTDEASNTKNNQKAIKSANEAAKIASDMLKSAKKQPDGTYIITQNATLGIPSRRNANTIMRMFKGANVSTDKLGIEHYTLTKDDYDYAQKFLPFLTNYSVGK